METKDFIQGKWQKINIKNRKQIYASYDKIKEWVMDPQGYFFVDVDSNYQDVDPSFQDVNSSFQDVNSNYQDVDPKYNVEYLEVLSNNVRSISLSLS